MNDKQKRHDRVDITDEVSKYSTKQLAELLLWLDKNEYTEIYFDGYDATIYVYRKIAEG
jgi:hypothetical protein